MSALVGPFAIASALLALGGASKAVQPADSAGALRALGLPGSPLLVRAGAAAELLIGVGALVSGTRPFAALVGASYASFAAFVALALRRGAPISSCGCFGKADTPPSVMHVVVNVAAALVAGAVAVDPVGGIGDVVADQPLLGLPFLLLVVVGVYLTFLTLTLLPRTLAALPSRK
ncbi:MAG: MauE/DoxX family redox-associated membrane protein [Acidimicrobiia bacterium]